MVSKTLKIKATGTGVKIRQDPLMRLFLRTSSTRATHPGLFWSQESPGGGSSKHHACKMGKHCGTKSAGKIGRENPANIFIPFDGLLWVYIIKKRFLWFPPRSFVPTLRRKWKEKVTIFFRRILFLIVIILLIYYFRWIVKNFCHEKKSQRILVMRLISLTCSPCLLTFIC